MDMMKRRTATIIFSSAEGGSQGKKALKGFTGSRGKQGC